MQASCISCRRTNKPTVPCGICREPICKACESFLEPDSFSFLKKVPDVLTHSHYCQSCFAAQIEEPLRNYSETLELAREVYFFFNTQRRQPPILNQSKTIEKVENCADRDETILRLGFFAAQQGYNAIIEAEITSTKVRNGTHQKTIWKGTGIPAQVDAEKLERHN